MALNCWQYMKCGREPGGAKESELGVCPAVMERRLNALNHGYNGGRSCWVVAGTMCGSSPQGVFALKFGSCAKCEFYRLVHHEEADNFTMTTLLLDIIAEPG